MVGSLFTVSAIERFDIDKIGKVLSFTLTFSVGFSLSHAVLSRWFGQIELSGTGIRSSDSLGRTRLVEWEDMRECREVNLFGFRYMKIFSYGKRMPLWIPLFLDNFEDFRCRVITYTDEGNPLSDQFEAEGFVSG